MQERQSGQFDGGDGVLCQDAKMDAAYSSMDITKLDFYGKVPEFLVKTDPNYASVMISNLGSIG